MSRSESGRVRLFWQRMENIVYDDRAEYEKAMREFEARGGMTNGYDPVPIFRNTMKQSDA